MLLPIQLPAPSSAERTPLVEALLGRIEHLLAVNRQQAETIQQLRDEIAVLKGEQGKPDFKASGMESRTPAPTRHRRTRMTGVRTLPASDPVQASAPRPRS